MRTRRSPRNQARLWRALGGGATQPVYYGAPLPLRNRDVRAVQAERCRIVREAITELEQLHSAAHPACRDEGPETCPTWGAIHALRSLLPPEGT